MDIIKFGLPKMCEIVKCRNCIIKEYIEKQGLSIDELSCVEYFSEHQEEIKKFIEERTKALNIIK